MFNWTTRGTPVCRVWKCVTKNSSVKIETDEGTTGDETISVPSKRGQEAGKINQVGWIVVPKYVLGSGGEREGHSWWWCTNTMVRWVKRKNCDPETWSEVESRKVQMGLVWRDGRQQVVVYHQLVWDDIGFQSKSRIRIAILQYHLEHLLMKAATTNVQLETI